MPDRWHELVRQETFHLIVVVHPNHLNNVFTFEFKLGICLGKNKPLEFIGNTNSVALDTLNYASE